MLLPLPSVKDLLCRKSPGKRLPPSVFGSADFRLLCLQQATFSASGLITAIDHWIAFMLLSIIGINMIREAFSGDEESSNDLLDCKTMFPLAVATSIDALAVGITFAFLNVHIIPAVSFIGVITFIIAAAGVKIGNIFGTRYKAKAELAGGIILILLGVKILLEHLGIF